MKALNVFGIIFAWILSIALVVMLIVAPITLSALSVLDPETILESVGEGVTKQDDSAAAAPKYTVQTLSAENKGWGRALGGLDINSIGQAQSAEDIREFVLGLISDSVGENLDEKTVTAIINSDLTKELVNAYIEDLTNVVTGKTDSSQFTDEKIAQIVEDNMDDVLEAVIGSGEEFTAEQKELLKDEIQKLVKDNTQVIAQEIIKAIPAPEKLVETNAEVKLALMIMAQRDKIKTAIVSIIVVLCVLIFALRYPGFRGLRWLSTGLFIGGGVNVVICMALGVASTAIIGMVEGLNAVNFISVDDIVNKILSQMTTGVIVRTVIIFVAAIVLLVGYILLKPFVGKKAKKEQPVAEGIPEIGPVFVPTPAPVSEAVPVAPEYTAVTIEPELIADNAPEVYEEPKKEI